jgi:hypothetical protein
LRAVLRHGPVARSTIARLTGLSPAGVSRHCGSLADRGLLLEAEEPVSRNGMGRPHVPVDIDTARHTVCGVHIAHAQCTLSLLDLLGNVLAQQEIPHEDGTPATTLRSVALALPAFLDGRRPLALGVAAGGWVDTNNGVSVEHASLGWTDVPVREILTRATNLPVHADSHARALVQAEQLFGQVRARESVLHLFVQRGRRGDRHRRRDAPRPPFGRRGRGPSAGGRSGRPLWTRPSRLLRGDGVRRRLGAPHGRPVDAGTPCRARGADAVREPAGAGRQAT